jgi:hypothetical protein
VPGVSRHDTPNGCRCTRTSLGAPPTPRFGVSEAKVANPGRRNASRKRDGLFDILRRSASAVAAHFGETNPTNPSRVVPAKAGTHDHGLWLSVPALRPHHGRRPGRRSFIRTRNQPAAVETTAGSPCLFPACYLQGAPQPQRVEPSAPRAADLPPPGRRPVFSALLTGAASGVRRHLWQDALCACEAP